MNQEKQLKDYPIHFYLGCEVIIVNDISEDEDGVSDVAPKVGSIGRLSLINEGGFTIQCSNDSEEWVYGIEFENSHIALWDSKNFKLLLRPLSDMTEEERKEYESIGEVEYRHSNGVIYHNGTEVYYLLSKGFDLFELIPAGLAIDATTNSISKSIK